VSVWCCSRYRWVSVLCFERIGYLCFVLVYDSGWCSCWIVFMFGAELVIGYLWCVWR
jgi:hypothetical protein